MSAQSSENRIQVLDAFRGIAAIMVVLFHYTMDKSAYNFGFKLGSTGVDLFFIISGFVIFMSLSKVDSAGEFILKRVARLYPTYWASVTFTLLTILLACSITDKLLDPNLWSNYFWNLSMFQFYADVPNLDGPYWTMIIEMLFYILMILLYQFNLLRFASYFGLGISVFLALALNLFPGFPYFLILVEKIPLLQFMPLFFAGICFYEIYRKKNLKRNYLFVLIFFCCQVFMFRFSGRSARYINHYEYSFMLLAFFSLFVAFVRHKLNFTINKVTLFLGKISFALYLIHQFFGAEFLIPYFQHEFHLNFWLAALLIALPLTIIAAALITYLIEIPVNRFLRQKIASKPGK